jgi:hypothetical protein
MNIFYLVNKNTGEVLSVGPLPETWNNVTGMANLAYEAASDLTWSGNPGYGFLTEEDVRKIPGIQLPSLENLKNFHHQDEWGKLKETRHAVIDSLRWRIERHSDEKAMGLTPTEDIRPLLKYIQQLRDITKTYTNPYEVVWPPLPVLPSYTG